jgi:hypothetical protein
VVLQYGPDGGVYVADWHDTGECHNYEKVQPCGRVFKVTYGTPKPGDVNLEKLSDEELVRLQLHKNEWWARHARRLLQERAAAGKLDKGVRPLLLTMLAEQPEIAKKLPALWALHCTGALDEKTLLGVLDSKEDDLRGWAVRLLAEERQVADPVAAKMAEMARSDTSAAVRLALASALQRLPLARRWAIADELAGHAEDAADANLPLMIWYGIEPLVPADRERAAGLLAKARIPLLRQYIARRIAAAAD